MHLSSIPPYELREFEDNVFMTPIKGQLILTNNIFQDNRGYFRETFNKRTIDMIQKYTGIDFRPVQANHSHSMPNVVRGIHIERLNKFITILRGRALGLWVDLRIDSETFGEVFTRELLEEESIFIPSGVGNAFAVLGTEPVDYTYLLDKDYRELTDEDKQSISVVDPYIVSTLKEKGVTWPPMEEPTISQRDFNAISLKDKFPQSEVFES